MVRVMCKRTVRESWERPVHGESERRITQGHHVRVEAYWDTPQQLKADRGTASVLKHGRVVFNIAGNKYRVIVAIRYDLQIAWVRFVGTHAQYDQIDAETV